MSSIAEQVCSRVTTLLTGTTNAAGVVYRDRNDAFTRDESPALLIEAADETTQPLGGATTVARPAGQVDRDVLRLTVTTCVRSANWQTVADAVRVQAHALVMADPVLRTLVGSIQRERCEWRSASSDTPFGYASQAYLITYLTRAHALDAGG